MSDPSHIQSQSSQYFMLLRYGSQKTYRSQRVSVSNILHFTNILITKLWMSIFMLTSEVLKYFVPHSTIFFLLHILCCCSFHSSTTRNCSASSPCCSISILPFLRRNDEMMKNTRWWWGRSKLKDSRESEKDAAIGADRSHLKYNHQTAVLFLCLVCGNYEKKL